MLHPTTPEPQELTPRQTVRELDKYIVAQDEAKKVVAIALRNRTRRRRLDAAIQDEVSPKNIIMIGPTGVGKTEIARRLARLVRAPFVKVEASKYTEVGYVGRDVESMVRDLVETSVNMVRERMMEDVRPRAEERARERLLDLLTPTPVAASMPEEVAPHPSEMEARHFLSDAEGEAQIVVDEPSGPGSETETREQLARLLDDGRLDEREVEMNVSVRPVVEGMFGMIGMDDQMMGGMRDMMEKIMPQRSQSSRMTVAEARRLLVDEEFEKLLDHEKIVRQALERAEQTGIVFVDEIDKVAGRHAGAGPDVSREGVQRDILPLVEGCTVNTKHGAIRTDHILFIAAGAFHTTKPSDLIPELQGRFPLRVELSSLDTEAFRRILTEPEFSLIRQYVELMATDGVKLTFTKDGVDELATAATRINSQTENIGARRLHSVLERVLESVAFEAPDGVSGRVKIDRDYVHERLADLLDNQDLSRFIL